MGIPNDIYQAQLYNGLNRTNEYDIMPGVCILPLAEDPPTNTNSLSTYSPVVIARLHAPFRIRKLSYIESKQNNPPIVPSPIDQGAFVLVNAAIAFTSTLNNTGITYDWTVSGDYTFVENCASRLQDGFVLGSVMPYTIDVDQAGIASYLSNTSLPTIGAIAQAGNNAIAGYNLANIISPNTPTSGSNAQSTNVQNNINQSITGMPLGWSYSLGAFFPGNFFNDQLANGGGV